MKIYIISNNNGRVLGACRNDERSLKIFIRGFLKEMGEDADDGLLVNCQDKYAYPLHNPKFVFNYKETSFSELFRN